MNSYELQEFLSTLLADKSTNYFTEEERLRALNLACVTINQETQFLRDVYEVLVNPTEEYIPLPEDFSSFGIGADWMDNKGIVTALDYKPMRQLRRKSGTWDSDFGSPTAFTLDGAVIYLVPRPNTAGTFRLNYVPMPNELSEDVEPAFFGDPRINGYSDLIVYRAAWDLLMKDRDFDMADRIYQQYQKRLVDFSESLRRLPEKINTNWGVGDLYGL